MTQPPYEPERPQDRPHDTTQDATQSFPTQDPTQVFPTQDPTRVFPSQEPSSGFSAQDPSRALPGPGATRAFPTYGRSEQAHPQQTGSAPWAAPGQPQPPQPQYGQPAYGQQAFGQAPPGQQPPPYGQGYGPGQYPPQYGQAPAPYGYGYGYTGSGGTNGLAAAALATGIGGIFIGLSAPVAIGLGIAALVQINRRQQAGKGMAIAGLVIGSLVTIGYAVLIGLVIILGSTVDDDYGSPEPVSSYSAGPTTSVDDLAVGECFDDGNSEAEVVRQPCTLAHDGEVIADVTLPEGPYPGDNGVDKAADRACSPTFTSYVGKSPDDSELDLSYWTPTRSLWEDDDRLVVCAAYGPDHDKLTSTVKNSHR
ncbi:DUF4190 domain-containing protein [Kribbella sp. NBC_00662]|uniref:DUF4190 domain-containing protein n=1 Tax=Kribbella sp. NBC_00662 TaxID=2975969 RepID=UPI00324A18FE